MGSGFACMLITGSGICCPEATFFRPIIEQPARVFLNLNLAKLALIHCTAGITYDPVHNRVPPRESFGTTRI